MWANLALCPALVLAVAFIWAGVADADWTQRGRMLNQEPPERGTFSRQPTRVIMILLGCAFIFLIVYALVHPQ